MEFNELLAKVSKTNDFTVPDRLLCLDPGHTTGWAIFDKGELVQWGQSATVLDDAINWEEVEKLIRDSNATHVVCEQYRVYEHKLARHSNSDVKTLRIIGTLDYLCWKYNKPLAYYMAVTAKGFCTDDKLKKWGFWKTNMRHSRDAIRHGCYYLLFHNRKGKK